VPRVQVCSSWRFGVVLITGQVQVPVHDWVSQEPDREIGRSCCRQRLVLSVHLFVDAVQPRVVADALREEPPHAVRVGGRRDLVELHVAADRLVLLDLLVMNPRRRLFLVVDERRKREHGAAVRLGPAWDIGDEGLLSKVRL